VSGVIADDPVTNAHVEIQSLTSEILGSATTDSNGRYSVSIATASLGSGYQVVATGGEVGGNAFSGELRAVYSQADNTASANATLVTTVICMLADRETSGDLVARRNVVLDRLAGNYVLKKSDWNAVTPTNVSLDVLRTEVIGEGLNNALAALADQLSADAIANPGDQVFAIFPTTLGGIRGVAYGKTLLPDALNVFSGTALEAGTATVLATSAGGATRRFELTGAPAGLSVDAASGMLSYTAPAAASGSINFVLRVTTDAGHRDFSGSIFQIAATELASDVATGASQIISDAYGQFALVSQPGAAAPGTKLSITSGTNAQGNLEVRFSASQVLADATKLQIVLPDPTVVAPEPNLTGAAAVRVGARASVSADLSTQLCGEKIDSINGANPVPQIWSFRRSWFEVASGHRLPQGAETAIYRASDTYGLYIQGLSSIFVVEEKPDAALCGPPTVTSTGVPVVFIHGYTSGRDLGAAQNGAINSTFGDFLQQVGKETADGSPLEPFLFRWITDQRFEDAAFSLQHVIETVRYNKGQGVRVHIVAHSFGGVLARTYLQGYAGPFSYERPVSSVTTFGSPYSGLGYDGTIGASASVFADQLSAYEMGDSLLHPVEDSVFGTQLGKTTTRLADLASHPIQPSGLSYHTYIGLRWKLTSLFPPQRAYTSGDGLISFSGQRFLTSYGDVIQLQSNAAVGGAQLTETVLGLSSVESTAFISDGGLSQNPPAGFPGWAHNSYGKWSTDFVRPVANCLEVFTKASSSADDPCGASVADALGNIRGNSSASVPPPPLTFATMKLTVIGPLASDVAIAVSRQDVPGALYGRPIVSGSDLTFPVALGAPDSILSIKVSAPGFVSQKVAVKQSDLSSSGTNDIGTINLAAVGAVGRASLNGVVRDAATNAGVPGATWSVVCNLVEWGSGTTTATGEYAASQVPLTRCRLAASAVGYLPASVFVSIASAAAALQDVTLIRDPSRYSVGGVVSGLTGAGLVLQNNGGDDLPIAANGSFTFGTALTAGAPYTVSVKSQPLGQTCVVGNGSGVVASAAVTGVAVSCSATGAAGTIQVDDGDFAAWLLFAFSTGDPAAGTVTSGCSRATTELGLGIGNPGDFLWVSSSLHLPGCVVWGGGIKSDYTYDPSVSGAIGTLSVGIDVATQNIYIDTESTWRVVVQQAGRTYYSFPYRVFSSVGIWSRVAAAGLRAPDFDTSLWAGSFGVLPDGNSPNFGSGGPPIRFGILVGNRLTAGLSGADYIYVDNFSLLISPP
jgi:pimeloyl-ACP methyl ester carboxylesterase